MQTPTPPQRLVSPPTRHTRGPWPWLRRLVQQAAIATPLLLPLPLLAGCGGGDPQPEKPTPAVNCAAHPETCK